VAGVGAGVIGEGVGVGADVGEGCRPSHADASTKLLSLHMVPEGVGFWYATPLAHWKYQGLHSSWQFTAPLATPSQSKDPEPPLALVQYSYGPWSSRDSPQWYSLAAPTPRRLPAASTGQAWLTPFRKPLLMAGIRLSTGMLSRAALS